MDAVNDPEVETVVFMSSSQVGKTEILNNIIGYFISYDPAPILLLQPTLQMAEAYSKDRLAPMIRDTPTFKGKIADPKARDGANTLLHKAFPGGHITLAGANSPASLASRPIRILLADEVDRYPVSAGTEGDPLNLAAKRTNNFWNRKRIIVSTPTVRGASRIEIAYEDSTRESFHLPCPECGQGQRLRWRNVSFEPVGYECESCHSVSGQYQWMSGSGRWVAESEHPTTRGFHLNELYSPWRTWEQIIEDFKQAKKNPETLKTFVNTSLGETWEEEGDKIEDAILYSRRENWEGDVPEGAVVLTAAVDVQDDRLEIGVEGWGVGEENWKIAFVVLHGDPARPNIWERLDDVLIRTWDHVTGVKIGIACATIDSGGHYTQQVYKFVKPRESRRVYAIKGRGGSGTPVVGRPSRNNLGKIHLFTVGVDTAKEVTFARLKNNEPGAGYVHFPIKPEFDEEYFQQLTAEQSVIRYRKGRPYHEWVKVRARNEALDIAVYNLAALHILNPNFQALSKRLMPEEVVAPETDEKEEQHFVRPKNRPRKRQGYLNKWR